ncbi:MAG TPA: hypothetical protein VL330_10350 [Actinomycetes bacterium]|nr:hypothetical protein [Actinomycetes bacterium]
MRRTVMVVAAGVVLAAVAVVAAPRLEPWVTDVVLDSREARVPCGQRLTVAEVRRVLVEQRELVRRIEAGDPGVSIDVDELARPGRGTVVVFFGAHRHREQIERLIGGDTFSGVPYSLRNV